MGWKNVKDYYRIKHIVHVRNDKIMIGSSYVSNLIEINLDGSLNKRYDGSLTEDLNRYMREFDADQEKLKQLINAPDTFYQSIPVYTYSGKDIIEKKCEAVGYPNVTHDGEIMYENTHSTNRDVVIKLAVEDAQIGAKWAEREIDRLEQELIMVRKKLDEFQSIAIALQSNNTSP